MKKSLIGLFVCLLCSMSFSFMACGETDTDADLYANWADRNQQYIDSIAKIAKANIGTEPGQWRAIHSYKFTPPLSVEPSVNDYIYCQVIEKGNGATPLYTDSVAVHYRGKLIPLTDGSVVTFDESYSGELNVATASPSHFAVWYVITGWTTALMNMKEGDYYKLYIPYDLGYGTVGSNTIKGYSTLIFDLYLDEVIPQKGTGK